MSVNDAWCRQNLADAMRQDEKVDRKIARNQNQFEALDFNAAVSDTRMSPASAFVATITGHAPATSSTVLYFGGMWVGHDGQSVWTVVMLPVTPAEHVVCMPVVPYTAVSVSSNHKRSRCCLATLPVTTKHLDLHWNSPSAVFFASSVVFIVLLLTGWQIHMGFACAYTGKCILLPCKRMFAVGSLAEL